MRIPPPPTRRVSTSPAYKYLATCVGAGISGLGGLYYTMDYIKGTWANDGTIEALGWLAVALVIFATWRSVNAIWGSYLFGLLFWVYLYHPRPGPRETRSCSRCCRIWSPSRC